MVRRLPAGDRVRDRRRQGRHLLGPLVSDRDRAGHVRDRSAVRQGDEGLQHLRAGLRSLRLASGRLPPASLPRTGRRQLFSGKIEKGVDSLTVDRHNSSLRRISSVG
ncbi:hypothetical protein BLAT2472_60047 [Burkholderia latens]